MSGRIEPCYISLLINGYKLSNNVIDSEASNNVMPTKVANALGLTLTKTFGKCFSMENKQVPLISQIKDCQFAFVAYPNKRIKMTILVVDVLASYGILLEINLCKDVGGEINMDWSEARIPVKNEMQKLLPEKEVKYSMVKLDDHKTQILFESSGMDIYFLQIEEELSSSSSSSNDSLSIEDLMSFSSSVENSESMSISSSDEASSS